MHRKEESDDNYQRIMQELREYQKKDFSFASGRILGSMCADPHPIAREAYTNFLSTNIGDPELFPGTEQIKENLLSLIADMLHAPPSATGLIVSGGTEGNITAMWLAKQLSEKREIIIPKSAHFSFEKIASMMDMKLVIAPLDDRYCTDVAQLKKLIRRETCAVVGIAGSTELGSVDPLPEMSDICYDEHLFFHVDAAFGGFVLPFLKKNSSTIPAFDFRLKGVSTISLDAHKMGYAAIPLGVLMTRERNWPSEISVESHCISAQKQAGILGTRSGGPVAAAYATMRFLGQEGYTRIIENCMDLTRYTAKKIQGMGLHLVTEPMLNVIGVKLKHVAEVSDALTREGWKINRMVHLSSIRIVLMPQITKQHIDEFLPVLEKCCKEVGEL
jgi:tyrosine decarboxylase/aspartate 1-decarboxylase